MVKYRIHTTILIIIGLYWLSKLISNHIYNTFIFNYFTDLLFVPFISFIGLLGVHVIKRDVTLKISIGQIAILVIACSLYFEWFLPNYSVNKLWYTSDLWDCLMYIIGGAIFLILQRVIVKPTLIYSQSEKTHYE